MAAAGAISDKNSPRKTMTTCMDSNIVTSKDMKKRPGTVYSTTESNKTQIVLVENKSNNLETFKGNAFYARYNL